MERAADQIRELHGAKPFQPFDIDLADGRSLRVSHPECLTVSRSGKTAVVALPDERFEVVDLSLVASVTLRVLGPRGDRRGG